MNSDFQRMNIGWNCGCKVLMDECEWIWVEGMDEGVTGAGLVWMDSVGFGMDEKLRCRSWKGELKAGFQAVEKHLAKDKGQLA